MNLLCASIELAGRTLTTCGMLVGQISCLTSWIPATYHLVCTSLAGSSTFAHGLQMACNVFAVDMQPCNLFNK